MNLLLAMIMALLFTGCLRTESIDYEWKYHRINRLYEESVSENTYLRSEIKKCRCKSKVEL